MRWFPIILREKVSEGERINLKYFGVFKLMMSKERQFTSPLSGYNVIPAHDVVKFRPSKILKADIARKRRVR